MTPKPTADLSEILEAIGEVPADETGIESTFPTVAEIVRRWGQYKDAAGQAYRTMVIVVTDEVGDDEDRLEEAIELAAEGRRCRSTCSARRRSSAGSRATWTTPTPRPSTSSTTSRSARGPRARCSSRSACRSGTTARSTTSSTPGSAPTP